MRLEQSDAKLFYQLWFPLLDFVNRKYHVILLNIFKVLTLAHNIT